MATSAATSQRTELAKHCSSKDWSKAIRILDSLVSQNASIQDIWNRAFCYSQLELHKHVIKDCDRALQLDDSLLQAYIFKGRALSALGRKADALLVWEQGYEQAQHHSSDLRQLLEIEELLTTAKQGNENVSHEAHGSITLQSESDSLSNGNLIENKNQDNLGAEDESCTNNGDKSVILMKTADKFDSESELNGDDRESNKFDGQVSGSPDVIDKLSYNSESCNDSSDASESCEKVFTNIVARVPKTKSISVDFRLSRGIAEVNEGNYGHAISIFDQVQFCPPQQILNEDPAYPEALIGRGTAYAFKRELDSAIADFTKAIQFNPSAGEAWKRRGQARAALGQAIEDLTKALEFESNSADILHERGIVNFKFKEFNAAVEDLSACVQLDCDNKSAYTYLVGLALSSIGEYKKAEEAHLKALQLDRHFLEAWAHLTQINKLAWEILILNECHRTLDISKTVIKERTYVYSKTDQIIHLLKDGKLEEVIHAKSCSDLYNIVGEDFWSATWCNSTAFEGKQLEGTRITLGEHGFDFSIRTPCTPARWEDYDAEMAMAWETLCKAYCGENYGSTDFDALENVRDAILRMTYYWYSIIKMCRLSLFLT
ncbi:hypothetical protein Ahy_Scaffold1g106965 isoform H [Arachis hypogaea]|uniref:Suppressor of RPS4-RLD 1 n=1 Tax=Arachis hypogaea TaxID=3818 RepID=A0A444WTK4_ARAHY|nr:hypothetical protein Ahy_Scaffold1g106965 isoform H [Arachis hypogaea]